MVARVRLPPDPASAGEARRFVDKALVARDFNGDRQAVLLVVSELATNAIVHARTDFEVEVDVEDDHVRVEVHDGDDTHLPQRAEGGIGIGGHGLVLVDELTDHWGCGYAGPGDKVVWFTVDGPLRD
jgi:anti-sigma regulatory factor (Ser/Thr protein kinase)